jgi:hypothetical protein
MYQAQTVFGVEAQSGIANTQTPEKIDFVPMMANRRMRNIAGEATALRIRPVK